MTEPLTASSLPVRASGAQNPADDEETPHPFNSRTRYEPGDDRDIWCADCEYHRDHKVHAAVRASGEPQKLDLAAIKARTACYDLSSRQRSILVDIPALIAEIERLRASASPSDDGARQPQEWNLRRCLEKIGTQTFCARPLGHNGDHHHQPFQEDIHVEDERFGGRQHAVTERPLGASFADAGVSDLDADSGCVEGVQGKGARDSGGIVKPPAAASDDGAARPQPAQEKKPAYTIEVEHEDDGRFFASWTTGDGKEGGCAVYSTTVVGALAELCSALLKVDEDKAVERVAALSSPSVADSPTFTPQQVEYLRQRLCECPVYLAARTDLKGSVTFHDLAMKREDAANVLKALPSPPSTPAGADQTTNEER